MHYPRTIPADWLVLPGDRLDGWLFPLMVLTCYTVVGTLGTLALSGRETTLAAATEP